MRLAGLNLRARDVKFAILTQIDSSISLTVAVVRFGHHWKDRQLLHKRWVLYQQKHVGNLGELCSAVERRSV